MYKYDFVVFVPSCARDFKRFKILKESFDNHNPDNVPLILLVPFEDVSLFETLRNGRENYVFEIMDDEKIITEPVFDNLFWEKWRYQQLKKLYFAKSDIAKFYMLVDSDCYFIDDFHISDVMYDDNTPYLFATEIGNEYVREGVTSIKNFFSRQGEIYDFVLSASVVFSSDMIKDFEKFLIAKDENFQTIITKIPYEFQWVGEYFLYQKKIDVHISKDYIVKFFWKEEMYDEARKYNTINDFKKSGIKLIAMQNFWVGDCIYKPSLFVRFNKKYIKFRTKIYDKIYDIYHYRIFNPKPSLLIKVLLRVKLLWYKFILFLLKLNIFR